jgi:hypothetical protein
VKTFNEAIGLGMKGCGGDVDNVEEGVRLVQTWEVNCGPRSDVMVCGSPNRVIQ